MDFEVFTSCEDFATAWERAWERFLAGVDTDVIDQFVFGFERFAGAWTVEPEASVIRYFGPTNVFDGDVCYYFVQRCEQFVASSSDRPTTATRLWQRRWTTTKGRTAQPRV